MTGSDRSVAQQIGGAGEVVELGFNSKYTLNTHNEFADRVTKINRKTPNKIN